MHAIRYCLDDSKYAGKKLPFFFSFIKSFSSLDLPSLFSHFSITSVMLALHALGYTKSGKHLTKTKQKNNKKPFTHASLFL